MSNDTHALPACQKCRIRKVRCDREAPKCGNCARSRIACIIVDPATGEQYARDYIRALEEREAILRQRVNGIAEKSTAEPEEQAGRTVGGPPTVESTGSHSGFVGDGSGLGFLNRILSEARWQQERPRILNQLAARPRILKQPFPPSNLPPLREAEELLQNYFTRFHIHHTFLMRQDVLKVFNSVYGAIRGPTPQTPGSNSQAPTTASDQDKFRLFMVFAISATTRFRAGLCSDHPYGYFKAAEALLKTIPLIKDPEAIQNLLLVARFGMYHHIGISLWEISQVCMRQCIELQLHTKPPEPIDPLVEQHRRRIFWECYVLDRYSSGFLGRPFAIAEEEINVALPVDVDDDHIITSATPMLDLVAPRPEHILTEMSIFICFIKLRRISSRIHSTFYSGRKWSSMDGKEMQDVQAVGQAYTSFSLFKNELDAWRITVPIFADPGSLYQRSDWHDFMYHKDMLLLARGAMHSLPSSSIPGTTVALDILQVCYLSASQVIHLYANLMDQRAITWTRSYFQVIFTAGLTVIYCISLQALSGSEPDDLAMVQDANATLGQCSRILTYFKDKMPDAGPFATVFDLLRDECINERSQGNTQNNSSSRSSQVAAQSMVNGSALTSLPEVHRHRLFDNANTLFEYQQPEINDIEFHADDLNLSLTEDLIMQLEAGIGEYAWGNLPVEGNFWDQFPFA